MNTWKYLNNAQKASESISAMVEATDIIKHLITEGGSRPDLFDYEVHIDPLSISLYEDGWEFGSASMEQFKNVAEFMRWVMYAISVYYYDEDPEEE